MKLNKQDKMKHFRKMVSHCYELAIQIWEIIKPALQNSQFAYVYYSSKERVHKAFVSTTKGDNSHYKSLASTGLERDTLLLSSIDLKLMYKDLLAEDKSSQMIIMIYQCLLDDLKMKSREADLYNYYAVKNGELNKNMYPKAAYLVQSRRESTCL